MKTHCDDFEARVDAIAMGDLALSAADAAHLEVCAACRGVLQRARAIEALLAARPLPELSPGFTARVMSGIERERWRAEQALDLGFNVAVAVGVLLTVAGVFGLAWGTGLIAIGGDMAALVTAGVGVLAERLAPQAQHVVMATLLLTMAIGVWWWAEGIEI